MSYETSRAHLLDEFDRIDVLLDGYREQFGDEDVESIDRNAGQGTGDTGALSLAIPAGKRAEARSAAESLESTIEQARSDGVRPRLA